MTTNEVFIQLEGCSQCPNRRTERHYTADSFEMVFNWICRLAKRSIGVFDYNESPTSIPDWCPLRKNNDTE
jgi:hypothetical protein